MTGWRHKTRPGWMMLEQKISSLPVLEGNQLTGIITESDVFHAFVGLEGKD
ncbi:MAG: CBS domain-containing protein [Anaerolineales bacterium]